MSIDDFGRYPDNLRWNGEEGRLFLVTSNEVFEQEKIPIELNTTSSTFAVDTLRRERGLVHIEVGIYEAYLSPVGQPVPELPPGADRTKFKAAIGVDVWNPAYGLLRLEACSAYVKGAVGRIFQLYARAPEAANGLVPVIRFVDSQPVTPKRYPNKTYYAPRIDLVGCLPREKIPEFAAMEPTVPLPAAITNDSQLAAVLRAKLEGPKPEKEIPKPRSTGRKSKNSKGVPFEIPDDDLEDFGRDD